VSGFDENGFHKPGTIGRGTHLGEPLTDEQIGELPDGAEIVITWCGGNGPWPERVLVDSSGRRLAEGVYCDPLQGLNRVTLGWDDATRAWYDEHGQGNRMPDHVRAEWARLRGTA